MSALLAAVALGQTIPVQVQVGATANISKHVPAGPRERFSVAVSAGQTLLVDLDDYDGSVQIFGPMPGGTKPLPSVEIGGGKSDWMNVVAKTGTYEIAVHPSKPKPFDLHVTLMDPHDGRIDPGITPDKISVDLGPLGGKPKFKLEPFHPSLPGELDDPWPADLVAQQDHLEIRVMSLDGLKKRMARDKEWPTALARLEAALKPGGKIIAPQSLPPGSSEAALLFGARAEFVEGTSIRGIRYIGQFAQDDFGPAQLLSYVFFGISRDGKYFVTVQGEITFPELPKEGAPISAGPKLKALQADAARRLNAAKPEAFKPSLVQLDAVAKTLKLP